MKKIVSLLLALVLLAAAPVSAFAWDELHFSLWGLMKVRNVDVTFETDYPISIASGSMCSYGWDGEGYGGYAAYEAVSGINKARLQVSGDYTYYPLEDGTIALVMVDHAHQTKKMVLPSVIDGYAVTRLGVDVNVLSHYPTPNGCFFADNVEEVVIPDSITVIGADIFSRNSGKFKSVTIPATVVAIGSNKWHCQNVYKSLPKNLEVLGTFAFADMTSFKKLSLPKTLRVLGAGAFMEGSLTSVTLPGGLQSIGVYAFARNRRLSTVKMEDGVPYVSEGMFTDCAKLGKLTMPASISYIGAGAFEGCTKLFSVTLKGGALTEVGERAFRGCSALKSIVIPEGVTAIGADAFFDCGKLSSVTLPQSLQSIGDYAFGGCSSKLTFTVTQGSWADEWAQQNGCKVKYKK